ncbi:MAG: 3-phosphoshikimate 1-carboxyvinyltransferase [Bacteroides sp.]|nr:3-phosphoshikimate 1-carboxyvinyltransferase [Bacteroides sp.]
MPYKITAPQKIYTSIKLPASKSISNRALIINALSGNQTPINNLSDCDDTFVMTKALSCDQGTVDIIAAGTAMRFLTAYFSVTPGERILTGSERMKQRPIRVLVEALRSLGAKIEYTEQEGYPPLKITGSKLTGRKISLPGNVSSQYISALLMIAPTLENGLEIELTGDVISRPYIELTLRLMEEFGGKAGWKGSHLLKVEASPYTPVPFTVENDWSGASYWYEIACLTPEAEIELTGLFEQSYQGDSQVAKIFEPLGVETHFTENGLILRKSKVVAPIRYEYDFINEPDLAQTLVVTCTLKNIPFRFTGLQTLRIKETDRIAALIQELKKLGYVVKDKDDSILYWEGERRYPTEEAVIDTYEDHRMAMAFAPGALINPGIRIADPHVVSKSYPGYWNDLQKAGFTIEK